jgi:hypothetical protein
MTVCELVESSLQLDPDRRNLDWILAWLHGRVPEEAEDVFPSLIEYAPLKPFNPQKVG